jgi:hypothetical protein
MYGIVGSNGNAAELFWETPGPTVRCRSWGVVCCRCEANIGQVFFQQTSDWYVSDMNIFFRHLAAKELQFGCFQQANAAVQTAGD